MKKLVALIAICVMTLGITSAALALEDTATVTEKLTVSSDFAIHIVNTMIDLGIVSPGDATTFGQTTITCVSNTGNSWELRLANTDMAKAGAPATTIANTACKFGLLLPYDDADVALFTGSSTYEYTDAAGWGTDSTLPGTTDVIYDSGAGETGNFNFGALMMVLVPGDADSGDYETTLTFTMIEDGA